MALEYREQGQTRQQILILLRRIGQMTASELSDRLGIGTVGVRQHMALLERDGMVEIVGLRRAVGRPSHLYSLTERAQRMFPRSYDGLMMEALEFVAEQGGDDAVAFVFDRRRVQFHATYALQLAGKPRAEQVETLVGILNEHGYMCEVRCEPDGSMILEQHNCPIDCAARAYPQACAKEIQLYEELLGVPLVREETIAEGGMCCRYRMKMV